MANMVAVVTVFVLLATTMLVLVSKLSVRHTWSRVLVFFCTPWVVFTNV